jgi:hypothetical protein
MGYSGTILFPGHHTVKVEDNTEVNLKDMGHFDTV